MSRIYDMTQEENIFFAKRNIVDSIWKSVQLEGIGMTYPETQIIVDGMSVSGYSIDEINLVNDLKHGWQFVLENINGIIDIEYIKNLHRIIGKFTVANAGSFRTIYDYAGIGVTDWKPEFPDEEKIKRDISNIIGTKDDTDRAISLMLYCMRGQFFIDGNKRISMLLANKILIENGCGLISIPVKERLNFLTLLVEYYETNNSEKIIKFLYDNCLIGNNKIKNSLL